MLFFSITIILLFTGFSIKLIVSNRHMCFKMSHVFVASYYILILLNLCLIIRKTNI